MKTGYVNLVLMVAPLALRLISALAAKLENYYHFRPIPLILVYLRLHAVINVQSVWFPSCHRFIT